MTDIELMTLALEALEQSKGLVDWNCVQADAMLDNEDDCRTQANERLRAHTAAIALLRGRLEKAPELSGARWEVHVAGPDDIVAFPTEIDALRRANEVNKAYLTDRLAHPKDDVLCVATVRAIEDRQKTENCNG